MNRESSAHFNLSSEIDGRLMDIIPLSIVVLDYRGTVVFINRQFADVSGYDPADIVGRSVYEIEITPLPWVRKDEISVFLRRDSVWTGEVRYKGTDGALRWGFFTVTPIKNDKGSVSYYLISKLDITERKRVEESLAHSEWRFRSIIANINEYIYSVEYTDGQPGKTYHSPRCHELTGYSPSDFERDPNLWFSMIHDEDRGKVTEFLANIDTPRQVPYIEHRIVHKKGDVRWVSNTCAVHRGKGGEILRLDGFILDISTRKDMIEQLRKLSVTVEQSPSSVIITDKDGKIEYVNPKFTQLTGYGMDEVRGQTPRILKSGYMSDDSYEQLWGTISSGNEWRGEFHNRKKNGELYWELASISPLRNADGEVTHYIGVKEDITERKKVEDALKKSEERLRIRNETMEDDLRYAQRVQRALLPSEPPECERIRISFRYQPLDMVGGDYFSFFQQNRDVRIFIGDISGHGVPAALFLSLLRFATENIAFHNGAEPREFLSELNGILCQHMQTYFITALYAVFEEQPDGSIAVTFASGGHPALIVQRAGKKECETYKGRGGILGIFNDITFDSQRIILYRGDRVFIYTDGIPETKNSANQIIGYDRVPDLFMRAWRDNLDETIDGVLDDLSKYRGRTDLDDDIVLIGCEIR